MKRGPAFKGFIYVLSGSLLLLLLGSLGMVAEAKEGTRPIGEMVSRGDVKYEASPGIWKSVEASSIPIFPGVKIKTEKGSCVIALTNRTQIEAAQNTIFSVDQSERLQLLQGGLSFRIPAGVQTGFKVKALSIVKSQPLQASKNVPKGLVKEEETIGSVVLHANGSATVKTLKGQLHILGQDRTVLSSLASDQSVTIPSVTVSGIEKEKVMVAQAAGTTGAVGAAGAAEGTFLGLSTPAWVGIGASAATIGTMGVSAQDYYSHGPSGPVCP